MPDALDAQLAAIVADPAHPLASLSVLAIRNGTIVYHGQFGRRRIHPAGDLPADAHTLYRIASISKFITTIAVLRLRERGLIDLDADVSSLLGFPLRNPHFPDHAITLRMLLSHTSSLCDDAGYAFAPNLALRDILTPGGPAFSPAMFADVAPPGAFFQYANLPWGVVATVLEAAAGVRFDRLIRQLVLDPLGLPGGFNPAEMPPADLANTATLYRKRTGESDWNPAGPWVAQVDDFATAAPTSRIPADYRPGTNGTLTGPQGNCRLSAAGLGTVMQMLMARGTHAGTPFLRPESVDLLFSPQWRYTPATPNGNAGGELGLEHAPAFLAWALGAQIFTDTPHADRLVAGGNFPAVGHLGDAYGLTSAFVMNPATRNGLIFLVGGVGFDPATTPGLYSAHHRYEERILTALHENLLT